MLNIGLRWCLFTKVCKLHAGFLVDFTPIKLYLFFATWPFRPYFIFLELWGNDYGLDSVKDLACACNADCSTVYVVILEINGTILKLHIVQLQ